MSEEKQWFQQGSEGEERSRKIAEKRADGFGPRRVWLPEGKSAKLTFLDSDGFFFYEHQLKLNGRWTNWFTCRKDFDECPICDDGKTPSYVCVYTVIDHSEYTDKTGVVHKNQKKLLVTKSGVQPKLARRKEALEGDLTYAVIQFSRDKREEASTGEDIEFCKRFTKEQVLKFKPEGVSDEDFLKPFDYMKLFAPKPVEELRKVVGSSVVGSEPPPQESGASAPEGAARADETDINELL